MNKWILNWSLFLSLKKKLIKKKNTNGKIVTKVEVSGYLQNLS